MINTLKLKQKFTVIKYIQFFNIIKYQKIMNIVHVYQEYYPQIFFRRM